MPIQYSFVAEQRALLEEWTGPVTAPELREYWLLLMADRTALAIRRSVADLRCCEISFSAEELQHLVRTLLAPRLEALKWISAIVVDDPALKVMGHLYQAYAQSFNRSQIFLGRAEALEWTLAQPL